MKDKKRTLQDFLSDEPESKEEMNSEASIPSLLFKARNDAHITHLMNRDKTMATHKALEAFYEEVVDLADGFIETSLVWYPVSDICVEESCCIKNPVEYFKNLYSQIDTLRVQYKESFLQNQIDEMQTLISQTIYRLTYMTT